MSFTAIVAVASLSLSMRPLREHEDGTGRSRESRAARTAPRGGTRPLAAFRLAWAKLGRDASGLRAKVHDDPNHCGRIGRQSLEQHSAVHTELAAVHVL